MPKRLEIYRVRDFVLRESGDVRPCIVIDVYSNGDAVLVPLSSQMDMYREGVDFLIDNAGPEFGATGLARTCYAIRDRVGTVSASQLIQRRGQLVGELAARFLEWL